MNSKGAIFLSIAALVLASLIVFVLAIWGAFALWYQAPGLTALKGIAAGIWVVFALGMLVLLWQGRPAAAIGGFAVAFALLLVWWQTLAPSNNRIWSDDVAQMTSGTVHANHVVLHNVRNFDWRTETDYTQRWETRRYDLDQLGSMDMVTSYWSSPAIAHVLISFGFNDGAQVVFSVEIRRERQESFSEIGGFFKEFELSVIAADERDVIRLRTNVRGEDDFLYRIRMPVGNMRSLFLAYVNEANSLISTPRFYNTITVNCTTLIYHMMRRIVGYLPLDYRLLLSGYLPEYVYKVGGLDTRYTLEELRAVGRITERAKLSDRSASFSADIRRGIPVLTGAQLATPPSTKP